MRTYQAWDKIVVLSHSSLDIGSIPDRFGQLLGKGQLGTNLDHLVNI